eukprot:TRINITY_DN437_c0_g1_i1.p1 TRINITY_DN437_c0_g1~~TRINITY_DN437_c0_g1_i1.p1  ORF type:complete len:419 (-),score=169.64 TRINITY_DN437_c0_g1_i1:65-1321(-)
MDNHDVQHRHSAYNGKQMRKPIPRKAVDYNISILKYLEMRHSIHDHRDLSHLQSTREADCEVFPPFVWEHHPATSVCTKLFLTRKDNDTEKKNDCHINVVVWTPEGRRLITGASTGHLILWNGLTFNFETKQNAHDKAIRAMAWSHDENWMITADELKIKYWETNMNNAKEITAHTQSIRDLTFCPTDELFASCAEDNEIKIWDFLSAREQAKISDRSNVKCLAWHPQRALLVSGSRDKYIAFWDPKTSKPLAQLNCHMDIVTRVKFNFNGNWVLSASKDRKIKLFDLRMLKEKEIQVFSGHSDEVTTIAWHPQHEKLFASGGADGKIAYWLADTNEPIADVPDAHETNICDLAWHPLGHILCSGGKANKTKFWSRSRPSEQLAAVQLNSQNNQTSAMEIDQQPFYDSTFIPGIGAYD